MNKTTYYAILSCGDKYAAPFILRKLQRVHCDICGRNARVLVSLLWSAQCKTCGYKVATASPDRTITLAVAHVTSKSHKHSLTVTDPAGEIIWDSDRRIQQAMLF